ncbi:putative ribonuclease H-like domain-containing protein [Tanacetum coccineum]
MVFVDNIIFGSTNKDLCTGFEKLMKDKFQMSSMGELTFFLGLQVQQKEDGIFISQDKYVAEILKKFNYTDVKSASTPVDLEKPLVKDGDADDVDVHLYRSMIGSLMYLIASRPDIMFAVCACARFQVTPKTSHLLAVKRIFRYLKGKPTLGLWYSRDSPFELVAYTDSDYAGATQDRKSTTGGSEYVAAASCCGQVLWIQNQLLDYGYNFMNTVINIDNNMCSKNQKHLGMSKEVGTPRYLSLVVPLKKVSDEAVHKELGDIMERAATTAFSLEAEQDNGSGPRCQYTILRDVGAQTRFKTTSKQSNDLPFSRGYTLGSGEDSMKLLELMELCTQLIIMSSPKFAETHNVVAFLEKPVESDGFAEIIDFLKASSVHYALTIQALIDKKKLIITEASIRSNLHLKDAEGTDCLPTPTIFEERARMRYEKPSQKLTFYKAFFSPQWKYFIHTITQCLSAKSTAWNEFSSTMASLIICLATNQKYNMSKYIFDAMLRYMSHYKKIFVNPSRTKKFFANMKRAGKNFSRRITPLFDTMMVQASEEVGEDSDHLTDSNHIPIVDQPSTSSQPKQKQKSKRRQRKEAEVAHDETEHEESVPTPSNDPLPSGEDNMHLNDLMVLCTKLQTQVLDLEKAKDAQAKEIVDLKKRVQRLERKKKSRTTGLKRLKKVGMSRRVETYKDQESLGDHEDASKQGRSIKDIDANAEVTLVNETQERQDDDLMFDTGVLDADEVFVDVTTVEKEEQSTKTGEAVTTAGVEDSVAPTISTTVEETLAQTLMEIKAVKPKAKGIVFHDQEEQVSISKPTISVTQPSIKDKGKSIMQEPERPLKIKDQVALDEQMARDIQA